MPTRYVALLRGINVGRNKRIAMADLRGMLADLGYGDARTLLQSGNAVFAASDSPSPSAVATRIEQAIWSRFGMDVRCVVRTGEDVAAVVDGHPLRDVATDGSKMLVLFLSDALNPDLLAAHDPAALAPGQTVLGDRVIYQWCPDGVLAAPAVGAFVEKKFDVVVTARNWNTLVKLQALAGG